MHVCVHNFTSPFGSTCLLMPQSTCLLGAYYCILNSLKTISYLTYVTNFMIFFTDHRHIRTIIKIFPSHALYWHNVLEDLDQPIISLVFLKSVSQ